MRKVMLLAIGASMALVLASAGPVIAQSSAKQDRWADWRFLIGSWETDPGPANAGNGWFTLIPDVQGNVLVRKNHAEYPPANGKPATIHDDLMVIYQSGDSGFKAHYYDSEGHTIDYEASFSSNKDSLMLVSAAAPDRPRFRLLYLKGEPNAVKIIFAIAPPGSPDSFSTYLEGSVHRKIDSAK